MDLGTLLKFRGICRGLIEAAGSCRQAAGSGRKFRGICRGLIEALRRMLLLLVISQNSAASAAASLKRVEVDLVRG